MASTVLLQSVQGNLDFVGDPNKADGWYGYPDSLYTVAITTQNFLGKLYVEATLAIQPTDSDWFTLPLDPVNSYLTFPANSSVPTGQNGGDAGTLGYSFRGNYLYIRSRVVRSDVYSMNTSPDDIASLGDVRVVMSQTSTIYSASTLPPVSLTNGGGSFIALQDSPQNYSGNANSFLVVNPGATAVTFRQSTELAFSGNIQDATGTLPLANGGTGATSFPQNSILIGNDSNNSSLNTIDAPTTAKTVLSWTGSQFAWVENTTNSSSPLTVKKDGANSFTTSTVNFTGNAVTVTNNSGTATIAVQPGLVLPTGAKGLACYTVRLAYNMSNTPTSVMSQPTGWNITLTPNVPTVSIIHNLNLRLSHFTVIAFDGTTSSTVSEGNMYGQTGATFTDLLSLTLHNMSNINLNISQLTADTSIYIDLFFVTP